MNESKEVEGIPWGQATILNAEWEGVPLRQFLLALGVPGDFQDKEILKGAHVHFTSDQQCEQAEVYEASIQLQDAM